MHKWLRRGLIALGIVAVMFVGVCLLLSYSLGHRKYEVDGNIQIKFPGPGGVRFPAIACMWANSYGMASPSAALDEPQEPRERLTAHVICRLPKGGLSIPFHVSEYTTTGRGLLIGAFLRTIPNGHPSCSDPNTITAAVLDSGSELASVCSKGVLPSKSEIALMAPFDDENGRPTKTVKVVVLRTH